MKRDISCWTNARLHGYSLKQTPKFGKTLHFEVKKRTSNLKAFSSFISNRQFDVRTPKQTLVSDSISKLCKTRTSSSSQIINTNNSHCLISWKRYIDSQKFLSLHSNLKKKLQIIEFFRCDSMQKSCAFATSKEKKHRGKKKRARCTEGTLVGLQNCRSF